MTYRLAFFLVTASLALAAPELARGTNSLADTAIYDTVDAIDMNPVGFAVTGIIAGGSTPGTVFYTANEDRCHATCERFGLLAMSKPGKFQFVVTSVGNNPVCCKLVLRTP